MQMVPISLQKRKKIAGRVVFFKKNKKPSFYKNKIVIIPDLNLSEDVFYLKKAKAIIAQQGGITSHGANLAREYNSACFNLARARRIIKEGTRLTILPTGEILSRAKNGKFINLQTKKKPKPNLGRHRKFIKKQGWYLVRAYKRSFLENFFEKKGIERTPQVLFGQKRPAFCRFDRKGRRWVKNFPMPEEIARIIIQDPKWFFKKVNERKKVFQRVKKYAGYLVNKLQRKLELKDCLKELKKLYQIYVQRKPYTALTQRPLEPIEKDFHSFIRFVSESIKIDLFTKLPQSEYARAILKSKIAPPSRIKKIIFPPEKLVYFKAKINYRARFKPSKKIRLFLSKKSKTFQKKFKNYCEIVFLLTRLSDETTYLSRTMRVCLNMILEQIGKFLIEKRRINKIRDVLNYKVEDLVKITKEEMGLL
ncbi:MAG: PEP-utilizing enzyme [Patescibacteria group bacterium]